jgi:membrane-bound lytic murein transglycosylase B
VTIDRRAFLATLAALATAAPAQARSTYLARPDVQQFVEELVTAHGFDRARLERWLRDARYSANVERLMQPPVPFGQRNWLEYRQRYLDPSRIQAGADFWQMHRAALAQAEEQFGVPAEIVVAIIGIETYFGRITGNFRTLDVFTTLTFDYLRRVEFYRTEFIEFLLLAREQQRDPISYRGSFAGAIGLPQFMPGSIRCRARPTRSARWPTSSSVTAGNAICQSLSRPRPTKASSMHWVAASKLRRHGRRLWRQAWSPSRCCRSTRR